MGAEGHSLDIVFNHQQNQTVNNMFAGGAVEGLRSTKPSSTPQETYLLVSALGPSVGSWGILSLSCSSPSHLVPFLVCLTQRGQDPHPHGSFPLQTFMPFVMSGMLGTKFSSHSRYHHHQHHLVSLQDTTFFPSFLLTSSLLPNPSV